MIIIVNKKCVIFDMDGVLADTSLMHFKSWKMLANKLDKKFTKKDFRETFGQKTIDIIKTKLAKHVKEEKIKEWGQLKEGYYRELVKKKLKPLPGVISLIKDLKKNEFKLAVGSSGPRKNVELLLNSLNIGDFFDIIISGEDVEKGKPYPDGFLKIADKLDINPKNCLVFEDAPVGIEAANRANMKCIAVSTTHRKPHLKNAESIIKDFNRITIEEINKKIDENVKL